jgi:hypothetical protein
MNKRKALTRTLHSAASEDVKRSDAEYATLPSQLSRLMCMQVYKRNSTRHQHTACIWERQHWGGWGPIRERRRQTKRRRADQILLQYTTQPRRRNDRSRKVEVGTPYLIPSTIHDIFAFSWTFSSHRALTERKKIGEWRGRRQQQHQLSRLLLCHEANLARNRNWCRNFWFVLNDMMFDWVGEVSITEHPTLPILHACQLPGSNPKPNNKRRYRNEVSFTFYHKTISNRVYEHIWSVSSFLFHPCFTRSTASIVKASPCPPYL